MSKVYSFRLSEDNPREALAREVIEAWVLKGYSLRYIVTEALLGFKTTESSANDLSDIVEQIRELITEPRETPQSKATSNNVLTSNFVKSIKTSVKTGQSVE
ncbi:MAG: hypothetical protein H8D34_28515 [Chloroflexi bacterium]|nr:hypothetical protein [Chloroflexota bacterium]